MQKCPCRGISLHGPTLSLPCWVTGRARAPTPSQPIPSHPLRLPCSQPAPAAPALPTQPPLAPGPFAEHGPRTRRLGVSSLPCVCSHTQTTPTPTLLGCGPQGCGGSLCSHHSPLCQGPCASWQTQRQWAASARETLPSSAGASSDTPLPTPGGKRDEMSFQHSTQAAPGLGTSSSRSTPSKPLVPCSGLSQPQQSLAVPRLPRPPPGLSPLKGSGSSCLALAWSGLSSPHLGAGRCCLPA